MRLFFFVSYTEGTKINKYNNDQNFYFNDERKKVFNSWPKYHSKVSCIINIKQHQQLNKKKMCDFSLWFRGFIFWFCFLHNLHFTFYIKKGWKLLPISNDYQYIFYGNYVNFYELWQVFSLYINIFLTFWFYTFGC